MANLTEEEKEILYRAHEIKERLRAEELEAGEISLEEANQQTREELAETFGPDAVSEPEDEDTDLSEREEDDDSEWEDSGQAPAVSDRRAEKEEKRRLKERRKALKREQKQAADRNRRQSGGRPPKKRHRLRRRLLKALAIVLIILTLILVILYVGIRTTITATNYQPYETAYVRAADVASERLVTNILLIGTDNRVADDASRSDAMIVLSINRGKGKLVMTSILRDSYVNIPGYGQNRINHAYQMGGAPLLIQTIEENFKIGIDYYVQVDFYNFIDVIDAFGGVDIEVTQDELQFVNGYVSELNHVEGYEEGYSFLNAAGYQTLNGRQALGYCRIRIIGTDFARTGRQRAVLDALMAKAKTHPLRLIPACRSILPDLTTNISDNQMTALIMGAPMYLFFDISQQQVPFDGTWWNALTESGQEVLGIDFENNNAQLRSAIYD